MEDQLGFTVVLLSKTLTGGLPGAALIFNAKVYADTTAIENHKLCVGWFSQDSQSVLQAIKSNASNSPMAAEVQLLLYYTYSNGIHANLCWVLACKGSRQAPTGVILLTYITGIIKAAVRKDWLNYWSSPQPPKKES